MKTFTQSIKEEIVKPGEEKTIFTAEGMGVVTHMWFGGCYSHFSEACINIYYNHEQTPSFSAKMFLLHGVWFEEEDSFSTTLVGKTGHPGGMYNNCNGVQREHNKKLNNGLPILHKVPPKRDYGRYFCILAEKGGTTHGGLTEKLSPFFHAKKQEVIAYGR